MLLTSKIVHVPAREEIDADINEYGHIGGKCRAAYGEAAIQAGAPDYAAEATDEAATDAITNILHKLHQDAVLYDRVPGSDPRLVLDRALLHFTAELGADY